MLLITILTGCAEANNLEFSPIPNSSNLQQTTNTQSVEADKIKEKKDKLINELAYQLHDKWREARKKADGSYEPRIKETKDQDWIKKNGGKTQVDIANTTYTLLPSDWQAENKSAAIVAMDILVDAIDKKKKLDKKFIESSASKIHIEWLKRNTYAKGTPLDVDYSKLPEVEKEKDRVIINEGIQVLIDFGFIKA